MPEYKCIFEFTLSFVCIILYMFKFYIKYIHWYRVEKIENIYTINIFSHIKMYWSECCFNAAKRFNVYLNFVLNNHILLIDFICWKYITVWWFNNVHWYNLYMRRPANPYTLLKIYKICYEPITRGKVRILWD